jgi:hypothetical protein
MVITELAGQESYLIDLYRKALNVLPPSDSVR